MWHYSVEIDFAKGELKALIINHPRNFKPPVRIVGEQLKAAWERLGRFTASHWEQQTLQDWWRIGDDQRNAK